MNSSRFDFVNRMDPAGRFHPTKIIAHFGRSRATSILIACTAIGAVVGLLYALVLALTLYSSSATVVVRGGTGELSASAAASLGRRSSIVGTGGDMVALLDGFLIQEYLRSPDAMREVDKRVDLFAMFPGGSADPFHPLPADASPEDRLKFYGSIVTVRYSLTRQTVEIEGRARRPDQAARITQALVEVSEAFINRYNARVRRDVLSSAEAEVTAAEDRQRTAQAAIRSLRNTTGHLDPARESERIGAVIQQLEVQRASAAAEQQALMALGAPAGSPRRAEAEARIAALDRFIATERSSLAGSASAISSNLSAFENASSDVTAAQEDVTEARSALSNARANFVRQQRYLLTIASPSVPTKTVWPHTWLAILAGAAIGLAASMIWLLFTRAFGVD